jgi:hypothetical protein
MALPLEGRLPAEHLRLNDVVEATANASGGWSGVFDPVPLGRGWWGMVSVPTAPDTASFTVYLNNHPVGTIKGSNPAGPLAALSGERVSLIGTGLTPSTQYIGKFLGVIKDSNEVAELVAPSVPQIVAAIQSGTWTVTATVAPSALPTTPLYGRAVIAVANTAVAGPNKAMTNGAGFIVQALAANVDNVYVGDSSVTTGNGFELQPGQATSVALANMNELYVNGAGVGDGVCMIGS